MGEALETMIISDPKAEIYNRTSATLSELGYNVIVLNLRDPKAGVCWNPLVIPYKLFCDGEIDRAYEFTNDIAMNLIAEGQSQKDPFWDNSAGSFFFGLALLLFKSCKEFGMPIESVNITNILNLREALLSEKVRQNNNVMWRYAKTDHFIASTLIGTVEAASDTRAGIISVFDQKMRLFSIQPTLTNMLSFNEIAFEDLTQKPTAIFLIVPDEKTGYHGLVSLFVKQSYEHIIYNAQKN